MTRRANNEGTIFRRKDGRWCGAYFVPRPGGRGYVRKYVYGKTRAEVHAKLTEVIRKVQQGKPVPVSRQTVKDYLNEWLEQVAVHRVRSSTLQGYRINVRSTSALGSARSAWAACRRATFACCSTTCGRVGCQRDPCSTCTPPCVWPWSTRSERSCCRATPPSWCRHPVPPAPTASRCRSRRPAPGLEGGSRRQVVRAVPRRGHARASPFGGAWRALAGRRPREGSSTHPIDASPCRRNAAAASHEDAALASYRSPPGFGA